MSEWNKVNAIASGRAARGMTQDHLAQKLTEITGDNWTRDKVASLENGRKTFTVDILEAVAKAQELPISFYMFGPSESNSAMGGYLSPFSFAAA